MIMLLGSKSKLGEEINEYLKKNFSIKSFDKKSLDICNLEQLKKELDLNKPKILINTAAFTNVDLAEKQRKKALETNGHATGLIAHECYERKIMFIHFSTDYVFNGFKKTPYLENDKPDPINYYGYSKLYGEQEIIKSNCYYFIFRISWLISINGKDFIKTILKKALNENQISVVSDQYGAPTSTALIGKVIKCLITDYLTQNFWEKGIYHLTPNGKTNWFEIAKLVLNLANQSESNINFPLNNLNFISSDKYPSLAKRPSNSLLNNKKLDRKLSFDLPNWEDDINALFPLILKSNFYE